MIISQLVAIGGLSEKEPYRTFVDKNGVMRKGLIIGADIDIWDTYAPIVLKSYEYDDEKRYLYALGNLPGMGSQPSLCFPLNYAKWKDARSKKSVEAVLQNSSNLGRVLIRIRESDDPLVKTCHDWLKANIGRVYESVSDFLFAESKFTIKDAPRWLVFRVRESRKGQFRWPGEIDIFKGLYVGAYSKSASEGDVHGLCHGCGQDKTLVPGFRDAMMYTLDQAGYAIGLDYDKSQQFMICSSCLDKATAGLNILNSELTFYAFSIQKTQKEKIPVKYLVVPNARDHTDLENCILSVGKASRESIPTSVRSVQDMIERAERKRDLELSETLSVLPHQLSYTVVFFSEEQTSRMKKIMGSYFFPGTRLHEINKILSETATGFELSRQTELKTGRLYHLMGSRLLTEFLAALFLGTPVDRERFIRAAVVARLDDKESTLREIFLPMVRERGRGEKAKQRGSVSAKIRDILTVYDVLQNNGLMGDA